tara:strand:+ start:1188 stop:1970 length:783 start_codon:yes stop_codon:yes gene_type:complete
MNNLRKFIRKIILEGHQKSRRHRVFYHRLSDILGNRSNETGHTDLSKAEAKKVKDLYRRFADQSAFDEYELVHWVKKPSDLLRWVDRSKDELSCGIYSTRAYSNPYGQFGLWVDGYVSLAVWEEDDAITGFQNQFVSDDPDEQTKLDHMAASSGKNKVPSKARNPKGNRGEDSPFWGHGPFILTAADFRKNEWGDPKDITPWMTTEALVDNWRCKGIVLASLDKLSGNEEELAEAAIAFGVPVYESDFWTKLIDADGNIL